ncbi:aldo/keto reductase [Periweissella cryptocerci]|uniref:Aldo/keto reductase n=1 Tax=Periweissella cryptocerci TaxID=2506420 RepID=A0A4P6YUU1_9LACO|nr:aldo/keto reductase [Periweissella cryptocerci]QBO36467.1 aldo/keto reductase [Periweissella cryptocerci]
MAKIKLGTSDLLVSDVALGVMRIDSKTPAEAQAIVEKSIEKGINFFDTADIYGAGKSSEVFGQALKDAKINREDIFVQSKGGIVPGERFDFSKQHILSAVDGELSRLGVDYLDAFLLHRPDTLVEPEEVAEAFNELEESGKVRHFGVSNQNPNQIELLKTAVKQPLVANQLQFGVMHTGMIDEGIHVNMTDAASVMHDGGILSYSRLHNMTIQAWSPFQYGFFDGPFVDNPQFPELNKTLQTLADKYGVAKNTIATAWILRHPAKMQVILGSMTPSRLDEMTDTDKVSLTRQEWYDVYLAAGNILP